jgi:hypothetical protein
MAATTKQQPDTSWWARWLDVYLNGRNGTVDSTRDATRIVLNIDPTAAPTGGTQS